MTVLVGSRKHDKLYMNGADISSLLYVKSNTFKIKWKKKILYLQHVCSSNK